jgi:hypothetical protein
MTLDVGGLEATTMAAVQQILDSYDALPDDDKHRTAVEILRRFTGTSAGDLPNGTLIRAAEDLFLALDAEEAAHAPS